MYWFGFISFSFTLFFFCLSLFNIFHLGYIIQSSWYDDIIRNIYLFWCWFFKVVCSLFVFCSFLIILLFSTQIVINQLNFYFNLFISLFINLSAFILFQLWILIFCLSYTFFAHLSLNTLFLYIFFQVFLCFNLCLFFFYIYFYNLFLHIYFALL